MKRIEWLDFGKGITIFVVMVGHVINGVYETKGFAKYSLFTEPTVAVIFTFVMPVFFAISGFLYHSPTGIVNCLKNLKKKAINLIIPYTVFSILYVVLQHFSNNVHKLYGWAALLRMYEQPISYLWFLYTLFFIFVLVGIFDLLKIGKYMQLTIYLLLFAVSQFFELPDFLGETFTWVICFYLGYVLKKHLKVINKSGFLLLIIVIIISLVYQYTLGAGWYHTNVLTFANFISKILSIPVFFYIFCKTKQNKIFNYFKRFGKYSLVIYLVHVPIAAVFRILLIKFDITNYFELIILIILITWYLSVFICWLSARIKVIHMIFFPYNFLKNRKLLLSKSKD